MIGWDPWSKKVGGKDIHCSAQNAALFVDLLENIFFLLDIDPPETAKDFKKDNASNRIPDIFLKLSYK